MDTTHSNINSIDDKIIEHIDNDAVTLTKIYKIHNDNENTYYDLIGINERNVPLELIYAPYGGKQLKEGDIAIYKKNTGIYDVYIIKVDQVSQSAHVKMIYRNVKINNEKSDESKGSVPKGTDEPKGLDIIIDQKPIPIKKMTYWKAVKLTCSVM